MADVSNKCFKLKIFSLFLDMHIINEKFMKQPMEGKNGCKKKNGSTIQCIFASINLQLSFVCVREKIEMKNVAKEFYNLKKTPLKQKCYK